MLGYSGMAKLLFGGVCTLGVGCAAANVLPNTILIDKLQEVVMMYRHGIPVPVPERVSNTVKTVMDDMKINPETRERIVPFTVYGFDMFHAGTTSTKYGAIVGIPSNFYYANVEEVDTNNITVQNKPVDWLSDVAQRFKESLILGEEAKKFLIAREIASVNSQYVFLKAALPLFCLSFVCTSVYKLDKKLNLVNKPRLFRGVLYTGFCLFGFGVWVFLQDFTTLQIELEVDKVASALGEQYQRGGVEAYSKLLERNVCLRELMGSKGKSTYSASGNDNYFLRQKHIPLTHRKALMELELSQPKLEIKTETIEQVGAKST